eukprot:TRINITY_DN1300_c0_g1_i1.p1 TRINITY_DN1300_c0_g1~~TRINITY_DN1300_c0_g1_i1.p1  ORF type:complete len:342 (+),score=108.33 TRINITY_DN1300_c0_g1_i1:196-1221(+)
MLTTNDKTIKLWKVFERRTKTLVSPPGGEGSTTTPLRIPKVVYGDPVKLATARHVYGNAHAYHINSISVNSDQETFLSADDLRINLWNFTHSEQSFNIVDIKPPNMDELSEVVTCAEWHPSDCSLFAYTTSRGVLKLADIRQSAICDTSASKLFVEAEDPANKTFFSEIISSISDAKFSKCGRYIATRDFMSLKLWDVNMERQPVKCVRVHDYLKPKLCDLYETDCIFDKFECALNGDTTQMMTGSYNRFFRSYEVHGREEVLLHANRVQPARTPPSRAPMRRKEEGDVGGGGSGGGGGAPPPNINPDTLDYTKKVLHLAFHPTLNLMAITAHNNLFIFTA